MGKIGNKRKNPVTDQQIIDSYKELRSAYKVADYLGIGATTVSRVLKKNNIDMDGLRLFRKRLARFSGDSADLIRTDYESGLSFADLAEKYGGKPHNIKTAIKRAGGIVKEVCPPIKSGELDTIKELHQYGMSQQRISIQIGRSQSFVSRVCKQNNIVAHNHRAGPHSMWKGGRWINGSGYVVILIDADDPLACMRSKNRYAPEHRIVMARSLGRPLLKTETVHHINGDKTDNRIENLQLRQGKHGKNIVMCCLECGSHRIGPARLSED